MSARRLAWLGVAAALACPLFASVARADGEDAAGLVRAGVELRRDHRNEEALAAFTRAFALSPTASTRAQLALAEQALGRWLAAEKDLDAALESDDPWIARNRASLEEARGVVRQHLAWLIVDVDVEDADVQLDGEPLARGVEARVLAGQGVLEVHARGRVPDIRRVVLPAEKHVRQEIVLAPLVAEAPARPSVAPPVEPVRATEPPPSHVPDVATRNSRGQSAAWGPIIVTAGGVLAIGVGTYFGLRTFQDKSDERTHCPAGRCDLTAVGDYDDAKTSSTFSTVFIGAGIGALVGGAVWWLVGRGGQGGHRAMGLAPAFGGGRAAIVLQGEM